LRAVRATLLTTVSVGVLVPFLFSCAGYRVARYGEGLSGARSVAIVTPANASATPGIELTIAEALRKEFLRRGALKLVSQPDDADLVVRGKVLPFRVVSRTVSSVCGAHEYSLNQRRDLRIENRLGIPDRAGSFAIPGLDASAVYPASADVEAARKNREEAFRRVAEILAGRAHDAMELWLMP
jgi:hypothetical protein